MQLNQPNHAHLYGIPFHDHFLKAFVNKIISTPNYLQSFILVPSRRILRELEELFLTETKNEAMFLPKIIPYSDMHSHALDWITYCPKMDISMSNEVDSIELKVIISSLCQKLEIPINKIDQIISFIVKYYTYCNDPTKINDVKIVYSLILELENTLKQSGSLLMQQIRQDFTNRIIDSWQKTAIPVFAILPVNSIPYIDKFLIFLSKQANAHIFLHGIDNNNYANKFSEESECFYIEKFLSDARIPKHKIEFTSSANQPAEIITLLDCHNYNDEAKTISLIARQYLEQPKQSIGIICDDNILASHIKEALNTWQIEVDYTTQEYLFDTNASHLLFLILDYAGDTNIHNLLKILTHPACRHSQTEICKELSKFLRKPHYSDDIVLHLKNLKAHPELFDFIKGLIEVFEPLINQIKLNQSFSINKMLTTHLTAFRQLILDSNTDEETSDILRLIDEVYEQLDEITHLELSLNYKEYYVLLKSILTNKGFREQKEFTESIMIITTVEARLQNFDVVIITNCNEKYFPNISEDISIVGAQKERELGFETSFSKIRLANYDFKSLINNPRVYATRSWFINNQVQAPSRFLDDIIYIDEPIYSSWLNILQNSEFKPVLRPQPNPTADSRPQRLSISAIEKLMRDPYAYYAEYILKIRKLDNIAEKIGNKDFGIIIHNTITQIDTNIRAGNEYTALFMSLLDRQLLDLPPGNKSLWKKRGSKIAQFLWEYESKLQITKALKEVNGCWVIKLRNQDVEVFFRADRIDIMANSAIRVIDFKTGNIPSKNDIITGYYPQLAIESLAIKHGKIDNQRLLDTHVYAEYIELKGIRKSGQIFPITEEMQEYALDGIMKLLAMFYTQASPYFASLEHDYSMKTEHFKHLSRLDEWFENEISKA